MTYALATALQKAVFETLSSDANVTGLVGSKIFDSAPSGEVPDLYVSLGAESAEARGDKTGSGALHRFTLSVISDASGFQRAKSLAGAICDALEDSRPTMERGRVVGLQFDRARARRLGAGDRRQIDLRFSARVDDA